jgi:mannose-1-phosphate guanylyltransferase/phosphomannomutase
LLSKLASEVLVVNSYAHTPGMMAADRGASAAHVADLVRASGAYFGAVIDPDGERLTIIDDEGTVLSDDQALILLLRLVIETQSTPRVALPVAAPLAAEAMCKAAGVPLTFTKLSSAHLMEVAASGNVTFAASQSGGFLFPVFLPAYDAAATLAELLSMLITIGEPLSKLVHDIAPVHIAHDVVVTPSEQKGLVMRTLMEQLGNRPVVLVDGVKVYEQEGWALVLPDPEDPVTHIWAEGPSASGALALAEQYASRLRQLLR